MAFNAKRTLSPPSSNRPEKRPSLEPIDGSIDPVTPSALSQQPTWSWGDFGSAIWGKRSASRTTLPGSYISEPRAESTFSTHVSSPGLTTPSDSVSRSRSPSMTSLPSSSSKDPISVNSQTRRPPILVIQPQSSFTPPFSMKDRSTSVEPSETLTSRVAQRPASLTVPNGSSWAYRDAVSPSASSQSSFISSPSYASSTPMRPNPPSPNRTPSKLLGINGVRKTSGPRKHIFHAQHEAQKRRGMQQMLFDLQVQKGFSGTFADFQGLSDYRARIKDLEKDDLLSSTSSVLESKGNPRTYLPSFSSLYPKDRNGIQRSMDIAKEVLRTPRIVLTEFDRLTLADRLKNAEIDERIRPSRRKLPHSLSTEADARVTHILNMRGLVSSVARQQVHQNDIARLRPGQWLNDEIINFYGAMVTERAERWELAERPPECDADMWYGADVLGGTTKPKKPRASTSTSRHHGSPSHSRDANGSSHNRHLPQRERGDPLRIHYFSTFFYSKLETGYEKSRLGKWTKKVDVFARDAVLIPINLGNAHWTFACINMAKKRVEYYDSLGGQRPSVYTRLREWLNLEHIDKKKAPFNFEGWEDYSSEETPQQENAFDCGVFACQFMEGVSRGEDGPEFGFEQKDMPYLRRRMLWEIGERRLAGWKIACIPSKSLS